jgi:RNA polymerase sigma-70 factor (ECF subfamily)
MPARSIDVHRGEDVDSLAEIAAPVMPELERLWEQEWDGNLVRAAVERVKRRIDPKQFQVFELSAIQRWPHEKIKAVLNVSSAAIYVLKHRVSSAIRKELKQLQKKLC